MEIVLIVLVLIITAAIGTLIGTAVGVWLYMDLLANSETFVRWMMKKTKNFTTTLTIVMEDD